MRSVSKAMASVAIASIAALLVAACGGSSISSSKPSSSQVPKLSYTDFKLDFSAMATIKILASHGSGKVAAILPDTVSSIRYEAFDLPDLARGDDGRWPAELGPDHPERAGHRRDRVHRCAG